MKRVPRHGLGPGGGGAAAGSPAPRTRGGPALRLRLHPLFLALLALAVLAGMGREALTLCAVLAGHEFAHWVVAGAFGLRVSSLEILPFGGVLRLEDLDLADPGVEVAVALAGPLQNLLWLGAGFTLRAAGLLRPEVGDFFLAANAVVGVGNLLPALPLDGGRALQALLAVQRGQAVASRVAAAAGYVLAALLLAAALLVLLLRATLVPVLWVFGPLLALRAAPERRDAAVRPWRHWARRGRDIAAAGIYPVRALAVSPRMALRDVVGHFAPRAYHVVWVVDEAGAAHGPWAEADLWRALQAHGAQAEVRILGQGGPRRRE
jgi:stage IV sporulation protein FB